jgi:hypothetical protein
MMSLDDRLREGLEGASAAVDSDVERSLITVLARRRRRVRTRRLGLVVAVAGLAALVIAFAMPIADWLRSEDRAPTVGVAQQLAADYEVSLSEAESASVQPSLAGRWRMRLQPDGEIALTAPDTFAAERNPLGVSFTADDATFRTNIFYNDFCTSIGTYTWQLTGQQLTFSAVSEACEIRQVLLTTKPWTRSS